MQQPLPDEPTRCSEPPKRLIQKCREDESGVQRTTKSKSRKEADVKKSFPRPTRRPMAFHTDHIAPELDALGYDPFDDQPTLVNSGGWKTLQAGHQAATRPAVTLLTRRKDAWFEELPEAARAVLLEATIDIPVDATRLPFAVAKARK